MLEVASQVRLQHLKQQFFQVIHEAQQNLIIKLKKKKEVSLFRIYSPVE